jgi:hypothetical protein
MLQGLTDPTLDRIEAHFPRDSNLNLVWQCLDRGNHCFRAEFGANPAVALWTYRKR